MAWIESHQTLPNHPKTKRLRRLLGVSLPTVLGHLHLLWWWAMDYASDGVLSRYDAADVADAVEWEGDPQVFWDALLAAGFADAVADQVVIHDWMDYIGKLEERKEANRRRQQAFRDRQKAPPDETIHDSQDRNALRNALRNTDITDVTVTYEATIPNHTKPNLTIPVLTTTERARDVAPDPEPAAETTDTVFAQAVEYVLPLFGRVMLKGTEGPQIQTALAQVNHDLARFCAIVDELAQRNSGKIRSFGYFVDRFAEEAADRQARAAPRQASLSRASPLKTFAEMMREESVP